MSLRGRMTCREADLAQAAMDAGELEYSQWVRVRDHLDKCSACAVRARGLSRLSQLMRDDHRKAAESRKRQLWKKIDAELGTKTSPLFGAKTRPLFRAKTRPLLEPFEAKTRLFSKLPSATVDTMRQGRWAACQRSVSQHLRQLQRLPTPYKLAGLAAPALVVFAVLSIVALEQRPHQSHQSLASGRPVDLVLQKPWRLVAANRLTVNGVPRPAGTPVRPSDRIAVGAGGRALFLTAAETILVNEHTSFRLRRRLARYEIELQRGFVQVSTRRAPHLPSKTTVDCGSFKLTPIGTSYAVRLGSDPELAVVDGQVQVTSNRGQTSVQAGFLWTANDKTHRLPESRRAALQRERRQALRIARRSSSEKTGVVRLVGRPNSTITIDGLHLGTLQATVQLASGAYQVGLTALAADVDAFRTQRTIDIEASSDRLVDIAALPASEPLARSTPLAAIDTPVVTDKQPSAFAEGSRRSPSPVESVLQRRLDRIHQRLARGDAAGARRAARQLIASKAKTLYGSTLRTIVAESHMRQHDFSAAARTYLLVHRLHPGTAQGEHGLFMAASLSLERLGRVEASDRHFATYLHQYPRGIHRHDAYFMRCIALLSLDKPYRARALALAYVRKHPRGRYARQLRKMVVSTNKPL